MGDYLDSDDMDCVLEMSRQAYNSSLVEPNQRPHKTQNDEQPWYAREQALKKELASIRAEIAEYDDEIKKTQELRALRVEVEQTLVEQLQSLQQRRREGAGATDGKGKGKSKAAGEIDYDGDWDWSQHMQVKMRKVFGIDGFRLCQKSVCNANMDGADIVCVMPTGGGKSLTYQLPALLTPGVTLVISPLIALITDQILHLREAGVEAVMLTGSTTKEESRHIFSRLTAQAGGSIRGEQEIKLVYVTPERIAKSKVFMSLLTKLVNGQQLARIVIDEAHCVSQLGHDFRPDYKRLNVLRQLFPHVPIMALSATCPPKVLQDLVTTLRLPQVVDGTCAKTKHTLYFSAPLYRKNLHYSVVPKPSSSEAAIQVMANYILENHKDESGIVYCLSKNDAAKVAEGLQTRSQGRIRAGVYHADVKDQEKQDLHRLWRKGSIKVVCATIAFGLGIDKGDVRFVLHHALSKSLDGFYQESGRAGRDGKDADCVLYYRPQDAARLSALVCGEGEGQQKLHGMLSFAAELEECRKVHFAKYFSTSSHLSLSSWSTSETSATTRCGHCDNCTRAPESIERRDVTVEAWQILKVAEAVQRDKGQLSLGMLADLARGSGGAAFDVRGGRKGKGKEREKTVLDLEAVCHGKVNLSKDDTETLIVQLILSRYLIEEFKQTAYTTNVYFASGPQALRFTRHSRDNLVGKVPRIECCFRKKGKNVKVAKKSGTGDGLTKRKRAGPEESEDDGDDVALPFPEEDSFTPQSNNRTSSLVSEIHEVSDEGEDDDEPSGWQTTLRPPKRPRTSIQAEGIPPKVYELSSD